jgi:RND superfamily putative drug exporter
MSRRPLTERLARRSAHRAWLTLTLWGLAVAVSVGLAATYLGDLKASDSFLNDPESVRAEDVIAERLPGVGDDTEIIAVRSRNATVDDPALKAAVQGLQRDVLGLGHRDIASVVTYYDVLGAKGTQPADALVSRDRHSTILSVTLTGGPANSDQHIGPLHDLVLAARARLASEGFSVAMTGNATWELEAHELAGSDLRRGELIGMPIALIVLVVVFGTLGAAALPFVLALAAIVLALALTALLGRAFTMSIFAVNVISMMGLALGIDYSLFIVSRFREERREGANVIDAIGSAAATASRAVLFSGLTVVLALTGLVLIPFSAFTSMGIGMILVVLCALATALTLLPALLRLLGDRVDALRVPLRGAKRASAADGAWGRMAHGIMRHPVLTLVLGAGLLIALALPGLGLRRGESGAADMPAQLGVRQGYEMLRRGFPAGFTSPVLVALEGDQRDPSVQAAVARLREAVAGDGRFQMAGYEPAPRSDFALLRLGLSDRASKNEAETQAVSDLRARIIPHAVGGAPLVVLVGGDPAREADMLAMVDRRTPLVFAVVLSLSFVLLLVAFRSLLIAAKAVLMNLLSVGASYGILTLVFQHGVGARLLGFQQAPYITTWVPLLMFCMLFGLSMDYQVFLLSRVREHYDRMGETREAVAFGISSTAGIITGAALIMVAVFVGLASGDLVMLQQIGFGLAVAVALDATIVRILVVPSAMALLGRWNWYLPRWLAWLPKVGLEGSGPGTASGSRLILRTREPVRAGRRP